LAKQSRLVNLAMKPKELRSGSEAGAAGADQPARHGKRRTERAALTRCLCVSAAVRAATKVQKPRAMPGKRSAKPEPEPKRATRPNAWVNRTRQPRRQEGDTTAAREWIKIVEWRVPVERIVRTRQLDRVMRAYCVPTNLTVIMRQKPATVARVPNLD
jgi:hypothetical protein